jgi:hypothetical protein
MVSPSLPRTDGGVRALPIAVPAGHASLCRQPNEWRDCATFFSLRGLAQSVTKFVLKFFRAVPSRKSDAPGRQKSTSNQ